MAAQRAAAAALIDGGGPLLSAVEAQARALKCSPLAAVAAQCTMHTVHTLHEEPHARRRRRTHSGALVKSNRPSPQTCSADSSAQRQHGAHTWRYVNSGAAGGCCCITNSKLRARADTSCQALPTELAVEEDLMIRHSQGFRMHKTRPASAQQAVGHNSAGNGGNAGSRKQETGATQEAGRRCGRGS